MTLLERFEKKYIPEPNSGCWVWIGAQHYRGYGHLKRDGGRGAGVEFAHRVAWKLHNGPIPDGMHVLHRCDNPPCVNPDHLYLGTHTDNMADKYARGRDNQACGERQKLAKLTDDLVRQIRADSSLANKEWARRLSVDYRTIWKVRARKIWKHVQ